MRRKIGYVAQGRTTSSEATVGLEITTHGQLYGMSRAEAETRGRELLAALDLDDVWTRKTAAPCRVGSGAGSISSWG